MKDVFDLISEPDLFDKISLHDIFDEIEIKLISTPIKVTPPKKIVNPYVERPLPPIKPLTEDEIMSLIRGEVSRIPKVKPIEKVIEKQIIKEIKEVEKKETKEFAEVKALDELKKQVEELKKEIEVSRKTAAMVLASRGGSGVIGIPPPEGNPEGYVLTISDGKQKWEPATGGTSNADPLNIGDPTIDGNWRLVISGVNLSVQRRESGTFVEKASFNP